MFENFNILAKAHRRMIALFESSIHVCFHEFSKNCNKIHLYRMIILKINEMCTFQ